MPKISIIIPVYNVEKYLRKCLDSICNQTLRDIEIICINDSSTDNSLTILKEYAKKDNRIKIIDFEQNEGVAVARNRGIDIAMGEYLGFVDSDDFVDLDFYERLYIKSKSDNADIVIGNYERVDNVKSYKYNDLEKIKSSKYNLFSHCSAIYKRKKIIDNKIKYLEKMPVNEDVYFAVKALYFSNIVSIVDDVYYHYYCRENSATMQVRDLQITSDYLSSILVIFDFFNSENISSYDLKVLVEKYFYYALEIFVKSPRKMQKDLNNLIFNLYDNINSKKFNFDSNIKEIFLDLKRENFEKLELDTKIWQKERYKAQLKDLKKAFLLNNKK